MVARKIKVQHELIAEPLENAGPNRLLCQTCGLDKTCVTPYMQPYVAASWDGELLVLGEGPGWHEDVVSHEPFTGPAGNLLRRKLKEAGFTTYILHNTVRCRVPNNGAPSMKQIRCCRPFLLEILRKYSPRKVLGVGTIAARALTNEGQANVTSLRGRPINIIGG